MELMGKKDVPPARHGRGAVYPWAEWKAMLSDGKVLKLSRDDVPKESSVYRNWGTWRVTTGAKRAARKQGLVVFQRRGEIYIELAERAEA